jgi:hypothetical protein
MPTPYQEVMAAAFQDQIMKNAEAKQAGLSPTTIKTLGLLGAGALTYRAATQANDDRRMGRTMRMQQGY